MREYWRGEAGVVVVNWGVVALLGLLCLAGCQGERVDPGDVGPYRMMEVEVKGNGEEGEGEWGPQLGSVERWLDSSLGRSERGLTIKEEGMQMRAVVEYGVHLIPRQESALMRVDMRMQLERMEVQEGVPMVVLTASAEYRHPFALGAPPVGVKDPISRILAKQAVDDVVGQLRDQAVVRQTLGEELVGWIENEDVATSARLLAIRRAVAQVPTKCEATLAEAAHDVDDEVAMAAARGLYDLKAEVASYALMDVAQRMSRDKNYDRFIELLPLLGRLKVAWVEIYLETVSEAHRVPRVREAALAALEAGDEVEAQGSDVRE